jgi:ADP-ribose pyrophosphatase YjhB (NUDIX family)
MEKKNPEKTSLHPVPIAVIVLPVRGGVLVVRRGSEPHKGYLALPAGPVKLGETWQEAATRVLFEGTGVKIDPSTVMDFLVSSAPDDTVLIFGTVQTPLQELPPFTPNDEVLERGTVPGPTALASPLHTEALKRWFKTSSR